jgi:hypothetical protein
VTDWTEVRRLIDEADPGAVAAAVRELTTEQRRALVDPLKKYDRETRQSLRRWELRPPLAVAGAGVLPGASAVAPWLARNATNVWARHQGAPRTWLADLLLDVLAARQVSWLPDLAVRLAARLPARPFGPEQDVSLWLVVRQLVTDTGIALPDTDGYVVSWACDHFDGAGVAGELRRDNRCAAVVYRMFEIANVLPLLDTTARQATPGWPSVLAELVGQELVDRATLLDACLGALQRGGRLSAQRGCLQVLEALAPDLDEVVPRVADYLALLPDSVSTVAGTAQRELRRVDEAGRLPVGTLCDAARSVLFRGEKKLVRAQLDWLDAVAAREGEIGGPLDDVLLAVATAFEHSAADVQQRALAVAAKHAPRASPGARAEIATAALVLPSDLRAKAAAVFGTAAGDAEVVAASPPGVPVAPSPRAMPLPIATPEELAAEVAALYEGRPEPIDPVALERVLAGLVEFAFADRPALAEALAPILAQYPFMEPGVFTLGDRVRVYWPYEGPVLNAIIGTAVASPLRPANADWPATDEVPGMQTMRGYFGSPNVAPLQVVNTRRLYEINVGLAYAPRPRLVSTPTTVDGLIDPEELVDRIACAAKEGWQPWPSDLDHALLRLPRDPEPAAATRAREIGTPAGEALATRLATGAPPDALVTVEPRKAERPQHTETAEFDPLLATVRFPEPAGPGDPAGMVPSLPEPERWISGYPYQSIWMACWPTLLPAHRDVVAANLAPQFRTRTGSGRGDGALLSRLADASGPCGPGLRLTLAYGLGAGDQNDRSGAVDALITLAGRGELDGAGLGEQIATLVGRGDLVLNRVVPALRDAANGGAYPQIWALIAAALPRLLPPVLDKPPRLLADLVALGVDVAEISRPAGTLDCLEPIAARRGSSQLVVQARRLHQRLSANAPGPGSPD